MHKYAVDKFLSGMGYDHSTPRALIYGPSKFGGLGIQHLYIWNSLLGQAFRINLNYLQLTAGIIEPILESCTPLPYIDNNWILRLRQFLNEINANLEINDIWLPQNQRTNDTPLTTGFMQKTTSRAELKVLNNWRMYYKVIFFLEICYPSCKSIQPIYLNSRSWPSSINY
jgi:hypothetical protein